MNWQTPTYDIQRPTGLCTVTGQPLEPGQPYIAVLVEFDDVPVEIDANQGSSDAATSVQKKKPSTKRPHSQKKDSAPIIHVGMKRVDISLEAWDQGHRPDRLFSFWRSTVPQPNEKKKLFVDDEVLIDLLMRLENHDQADRLAFRFVLAILLMRKKLLHFEKCEKRHSQSGQEQEWWHMKFKNGDQTIEVLNPQINDAETQQVAEQLGQILEIEI